MNSFQVFFVLSIACAMGRHHDLDLPSPVDFFFEEGSTLGSINVTWAHAVNSMQKLTDALTGEKMMIEADVLLGEVNGTKPAIPIMAHPPSNSSDLSFEDFLIGVINAVDEEETAKKGIKLDFKQTEVIEPALQILQSYRRKIDFPVWLNADVLQGPVNSTKSPVDAREFLRLTQLHFPKASLSLGWTTLYGKDVSKLENGVHPVAEITSGGYTKAQINEMVELVSSLNEGKQPKITFAVRAGLIANTRSEYVLTLLPHGSITLWGAEGDHVNMTLLRKIVDEVGTRNIYADVPFDIHSDPSIAPIPFNDTTNGHGGSGNHSDNILPDAPDGASMFSNSFHVVLLFISFLLVKQYFY